MSSLSALSSSGLFAPIILIGSFTGVIALIRRWRQRGVVTVVVQDALHTLVVFMKNLVFLLQCFVFGFYFGELRALTGEFLFKNSIAFINAVHFLVQAFDFFAILFTALFQGIETLCHFTELLVHILFIMTTHESASFPQNHYKKYTENDRKKRIRVV